MYIVQNDKEKKKKVQRLGADRRALSRTGGTFQGVGGSRFK